jgi:hypothetical protein
MVATPVSHKYSVPVWLSSKFVYVSHFLHVTEIFLLHYLRLITLLCEEDKC